MVAKRLDRPLYSYAEAAYVAHVARGTARRWLAGYTDRRAGRVKASPPPATLGREDVGAVSFLNLVEIVAIGRLKEVGYSLHQIREIVHNCQPILKVPRPLISLRFKTDGREIFVDRGAALLEVGRRKGSLAWTEVLEPFLQDLDYADQVAHRWWSLGHDGEVLIDPEFGFGLPVIAGSGVRTETILEQFQAGESTARIAKDFNVSTAQVERALRFEVQRAA